MAVGADRAAAHEDAARPVAAGARVEVRQGGAAGRRRADRVPGDRLRSHAALGVRRRARRRDRARPAEARVELHRRLRDPARPLDPARRPGHRRQPPRRRLRGHVALCRRAEPRRRRGDRAERNAGHHHRPQPFVQQPRRAHRRHDHGQLRHRHRPGAGADVRGRAPPSARADRGRPRAGRVRAALRRPRHRARARRLDPRPGKRPGQRAKRPQPRDLEGVPAGGHRRSGEDRRRSASFARAGVRAPPRQRPSGAADPAPRATTSRYERPPTVRLLAAISPHHPHLSAAPQLAYNARFHRSRRPRLYENPKFNDLRLAGPGLARADRPPLVGLRRRDAGPHARDDRLGHDLPAPRSGAPRARPASGDLALLPLLAVAHDRHGHEGMGRDPPQAPCEGRDRRGPAQPDDPRHRQGAVAGRRAVPHRSRGTRKRWTSTASARPTTGSSATSTRASAGRAWA